MLLKNLMEDKQLNYYQPLLSVRRCSSKAPSEKDENKRTNHSLPKVPPIPSYKSEVKSGPIRNAGTVPFVWEQSPGRPKDESRPRNRPPIAPKLPPGRILKTRNKNFDKDSEHPSDSNYRGEVPNGSHSVSASNESVTKLKSSEDTMEVESCSSGEGDEEYMDALDTLSRTESFHLNCSVSGISELDDSDVNTSGNFSADPRTRDFMLGRFLPAAKAMTSETPQHAPRKQPVVCEQPKEMMKAVSGDKRPPLRYGPNFVQHCAQDKDEEESDDDHGQLPATVCGLLPRFRLLNPVPGMSVRTRLPISPGSSRTGGSSSSAGSFSENENEHIRATVYEQRSEGDLQTTELLGDTSVSENQADQLSCRFNPQKLEGSALYRRLQGSAMSSQHYDLPRSAFSDQKGVQIIPGEAKDAWVTGFSTYKEGSSTFKELLADTSSNVEVDSECPIIEKTLYVDIVHKVESHRIHSYSSDTKGPPNLRGNALKDQEKQNTIEETHSIDSSFEDAENFIAEGREANIKATQKHADFGVPSLTDKSKEIMSTEKLKEFIQYEDLIKDFTTSAKLKVPNIVNMGVETQQPLKSEDSEKSNGSFKFPLPPPLPKSPSDSWLRRTLPSMSSRTRSFQPQSGRGIHPGNHAPKTSSVDPKWGTIAKTTKGQHQHELLMSISET